MFFNWRCDWASVIIYSDVVWMTEEPARLVGVVLPKMPPKTTESCLVCPFQVVFIRIFINYWIRINLEMSSFCRVYKHLKKPSSVFLFYFFCCITGSRRDEEMITGS